VKNTKEHIENYRERFERDHARRVSDKQNMREKVGYLQARDEEFTIEITNNNYKLTSDFWRKSTHTKGAYTPYELHFIKSVRKYVRDNNIAIAEQFEDQVLQRDVKYIDVKRAKLDQIYDNVVEIDLDEAYWKTALILGVISKELYEKGKKGKISKQARLTALGTLAKKTTILKYKGFKLIEDQIVNEPLLENLWYTICKRISDVMTKAQKALGKDFIFYWVDGIYLVDTKKNRDLVTKIFTESGYGVKYKKIHKITFNKMGWETQDDANSEHIRPFNYPHYSKGKRRSYFESVKLTEHINKLLVEKPDLTEKIKEQMEEKYNTKSEENEKGENTN
jgi:hypothetical protein